MTANDREEELHRLAERQGLLLQKSDLDDGESAESARFQLIDPGSRAPVNGDEPNEFNLTLDDVEALLTADKATPKGDVEESPYRSRKASADSDPATRERE